MKVEIKCVLLAVLALTMRAEAVELLTNGNFNSVTGEAPDGWTVDIQAPSGAWFEMQSAFSPDGSPTATMFVGQASPGVYLRQTVVFPFEPNTVPTLIFSSLVNTQWSEDWGDAIVEMTFSEPNGTFVSADQFVIMQDDQLPVPVTWTRYTHNFSVPPTAGRVELALHGTDWISGLYWDNVSLSYIGEAQAELVYPANMSNVGWEDPDNCGYGPRLHWNSAPDATGVHYVYFGTSETAVAAATTASPEYQGTAPLNDPNFVLSLADVAKGQTYYWRIDETTAGGVVKGQTVSRFSISPFTVLDTFDYASEAELQAVWGAGATLNGAAMEIAYNNAVAPYYTEVAANASVLGCSTDWTRGGNQLLTLDVKGHDNMADSMYVTLESNSGAQTGTVQYSLASELNQQSFEWFHFWPIDLQEFTDQGVQLTNVTEIIVGIGVHGAPVAGGLGAVLIDNIRLSSPMCLRDYTPADINSDCIVDIYDLLEISNSWLSEGYTVTQQAPARGPVLRYAFDEGSGFAAADSSGFGYHGTLNLESWGGAGSGVNGSNSLNLNNNVYVQVPVGAANVGDPNYPVEDPNQYLGAESTISLWLKDPGQTDQDSELLQIGTDGDVIGIWLKATGNFQYSTAGGNELLWTGSAKYTNSDLYTNPSHPQDQWVHYAFVKSYSGGFMRIYQNGKLVAETFADGNWSPVIDGVNSFFAIGGWRWSGGAGGYLDGLLDDFRVYDYALSQSEVLSLSVAGGAAASPLYQPLLLSADAFDDNRVNLKDFDVLAEKWMQDVVYP